MKKTIILLASAIFLWAFDLNEQPTSESLAVNEIVTVLNTPITITPQGKARIEEKMQSLTRSQSHYSDFLARCTEYFPVIEREFQKAGVPDEFKFLSLQESTLKGEAVSRSNAVGFWQFKEPTALEYQLRVDQNIDERKNIISSSKAAAAYFKKSNKYLQNWVYALLSYNLGLTGAKNYIRDNKLTNNIVVDQNTHQYIVHFLAHYYAFNANYRQQIAAASKRTYLLEYAGGIGNDFNEIAQFVMGQEAQAQPNYQNMITNYTSQLKIYNPWLITQRIPQNSSYCFSVIIPVDYAQRQVLINRLKPYACQGKVRGHSSNQFYADSLKNNYPFILERDDLENNDTYQEIIANGVKALKVDKEKPSKEVITALGISAKEFYAFNDQKKIKKLKPEEIYYIAQKPETIPMSYHLVEEGDDMLSIAQKYGIQLAKLYEWNELKPKYKLQAGDKIKFNPAE